MQWIDSLFAELAALYGARFMNQWAADMVPQVKNTWLRELREFESNPEALQYALDNLPADHCPMALEIRDLCRKYCADRDALARVPIQPRQTAEERARGLAILQAFHRPDPQGPKAWAWRQRARELAGERLTLFQRSCWREALASELAREAPSSPPES